ncbi:hypothetical protein JDV02_006742 [Purpureocillium takamizusanense]|uniref:Uncharacterized protein n=1 Tax=Purpureocillium takamizusanense TaxID=2060973 RepID=A0A9Q8VD96_9HYPO|nr:uncharacterized protein JDV02_006742 [Purpureocillium takamizusanense]UNI20674.1 hypothetical protein JDV02_006742 [Purpureocillium takamizusanense]
MKFSSAATIIAALAGGALAMHSEGAKPMDMDMNMARDSGMPAADSKHDTETIAGLVRKAGSGELMEEHEKRQLDALTKLLGVINKRMENRMEVTDMEKRQLGNLLGDLGGLGDLGDLTGKGKSPGTGDDAKGPFGEDSAGGLPGGAAAPVAGAPVAAAPVAGAPIGGGTGGSGLTKRGGKPGGSGAGGGLNGDDVFGGAGTRNGGSGAGAGGAIDDNVVGGGAGLGHISRRDDDFFHKRNTAPRPMSDMEKVKRQLDVLTGLLGGLLGGGNS